MKLPKKISPTGSLLTLFILCLSLFSCHEEKAVPRENVVARLSMAHEADGEALRFDQLCYENDAGNQFSVSRLEYYLSAVRLLSSDDEVFEYREPVYIDARDPEKQSFVLEPVPAGSYKSISFYIGLLPEHNCSGCLPACLPACLPPLRT